MNPSVRDDVLCIYNMFEKKILAWQKGSRQKGGARWTSDWNETDLPLREPVDPLGITSLGVIIRETYLDIHYLLLVLMF